MRRSYVGQILGVLASGMLLIQPLTGQWTVERFRRVTGIDSWPAQEAALLEKGSPVVRTLRTDNKQEVTTLGILLIKDLPPVSLDAFRDSFDSRRSSEKRRGGKFSRPPNIDDLRLLTVDDETLKHLLRCQVGECDLNLSSEMIQRLRGDLDATSQDPKEQAANTFRAMLVEHVRRYIDSGDAALGTYDNRARKFDLAATHRALLTDTAVVSELAPELLEYLREYRRETLDHVDDTMHWSIIDFGLKPTITISHTASYTQANSDASQLFIASKQIYSSRYLDASLTVIALLRISTPTGVETYLVFVDRSRSDVLGGPLGKLARRMVERESAERVTSLMDRIHVSLLASALPPPPDADVESSGDAIPRSVLGHGALVALGILVISILHLLKTVRRRPIGGAPAPEPTEE